METALLIYTSPNLTLAGADKGVPGGKRNKIVNKQAIPAKAGIQGFPKPVDI